MAEDSSALRRSARKIDDPGLRPQGGSHPPIREVQFLLACIQQFFRPDTQLPITNDLDWNRLIDLANYHSVVGFLVAATRERSEVPPDVAAQLRLQALEAARFDLTLSAELIRLLEKFSAHQIQVVSLKGPVLGAQLYGGLALRSSSDLDLLIHPNDVLNAKRLLESDQFRLESVLHWHTEIACLRCRDSQLSFVPKIEGEPHPVCVDLHWRLLPGYFPKSFEEHDVWKHLNLTERFGTVIPTISSEYLLLFLCAHGAKHLWERLGWICDIASLLQAEPNLNWPWVIEKAKQTDTSRMVLLGLLLASRLLSIELPGLMQEHVSHDHVVLQLADTVIQRLTEGSTVPATAVESARFSSVAFERRLHRLRFLFGIFIQPSEAEYQALKLPPSLHWLYYFFRPLRLTGKYVRVR